MKKTMFYGLTAALLATALTACPSAGTGGVPGGGNPGGGNPGGGNPGGPAPYTMTGTVTDERGKPLAGVEVFADNTLYYDMNALGTTDASGRYTIKLPQNQPGTWRGGATIELEYHGEDYRFSLAPDNKAAFATAEGAVRNFVWKVSGETPGGGNYGELVYIYWGGGADFDLEKAEVTLTPQGPIVDGSAGATITRLVEGGRVDDVPVGRYTVTARLKDGGTVRPLLVQARGGDTYGGSATSDFHQSNYGITMEFYLKLPE